MTSLVLYQFPPGFGLRSLSPFCTKLEAYLRLAEVPHEVGIGDPRQAPKGKLPYVRWDGSLVGDSQLVLERCQRELGDPLDEGLSDAQRTRGHLLRRTCEDHFYWVLLSVRWIDDAIWNDAYRGVIASVMPAGLRFFLPGVLRKGVRKSLAAHGLGRHEGEVIVGQGEADLDAFERSLDPGGFLLGDTPTSYDCSVFAMLEHLRVTPGEHPLISSLQGRPALLDYCARMNERIGW
jgi:hypothetical protein